ncbi:MAG: hypothetical protein JWO35_280 [Candidatus Saccharibacteria bacterium]|nr:hypothetical protein [Candidatus Saccharibacteria bacterium]
MKKKSHRQMTPKQLRAVQTSRYLRVTHHKHTGHRMHRRTTSYPMLAMIVLCVGVFLMSWTRFVTADTFVYPGPKQGGYTVNASVPGPAPTQAATIDTPNEDARFTTLPTGVSGTCPVNTYVTLYRNGAFSGVALCQTDGTYSLQTGLFVGANELQARVFSPTDVPGPMSSSVNVVYAPPAPPPDPTPTPGQASNPNTSTPSSGTGTSSNQPSSGTASQAAPADPLMFKTSFNYRGQYTGTASTWQLDLSGGNPPYAISVDWGDGTTSLISRPRAGVFGIDHTYKAAGGYKGSYTVKFKASDADGTQTYIQLLAIVNDPPSGTGVTNKIDLLGGNTESAPAYVQKLLQYVWPSYGGVVLMLTSFWLGERHELKHLKPQRAKSRHRHA